MGKFHDMLAANAEHVNAISETFVSELTAAYDDDFSIPTAKINEQENTILGLNENVAKLGEDMTAVKAKNYELLMSAGVNKPSDKADDEDDVSDNIDDLLN